MVKNSKSSDIERDVNGYYGHLKKLRDFLLGSNDDVKIKEKIKTKQPSNNSKRKSSGIAIPKPCVEQVEYYLAKWKKLPNYTAQEDSLNKLFWQVYPRNDNMDEVLAKAAILNDFYSTHIYHIYELAKHIVDLDIDRRLELGDLSLVHDIATMQIDEGKTINYYSFATKYCSHHNDKIYPIYDNYVEKILIYFRNKDQFYSFKNDDLKYCPKLSEIIKKFQFFYKLENYTLKEIDRYIWLLGKDYIPKNY